MSESSQKCEKNAILSKSKLQNCLLHFKMDYSCCFSLGGSTYFLDFLKKLYNIGYKYYFKPSDYSNDSTLKKINQIG